MVLVVQNLPANAGDIRDVGLIPGSGRSLGGGHGNPLQYSCLEHPMDRGAWWAIVHSITKSDMAEETASTRAHSDWLVSKLDSNRDLACGPGAADGCSLSVSME